MTKLVEVHGGRFECDDCGRSFVGTWHGPKDEMTCPWCRTLMFPKRKAEIDCLFDDGCRGECRVKDGCMARMKMVFGTLKGELRFCECGDVSTEWEAHRCPLTLAS